MSSTQHPRDQLLNPLLSSGPYHSLNFQPHLEAEESWNTKYLAKMGTSNTFLLHSWTFRPASRLSRCGVSVDTIDSIVRLRSVHLIWWVLSLVFGFLYVWDTKSNVVATLIHPWVTLSLSLPPSLLQWVEARLPSIHFNRSLNPFGNHIIPIA